MISMSVKAGDREYLERLGRYQEETSSWRRMSTAERLAAGIELWLRFGRREAEKDDPRPFYERARALGLYRG